MFGGQVVALWKKQRCGCSLEVKKGGDGIKCPSGLIVGGGKQLG